jgi:hypothetical protein
MFAKSNYRRLSSVEVSHKMYYIMLIMVTLLCPVQKDCQLPSIHFDASEVVDLEVVVGGARQAEGGRGYQLPR